MARNGSCGSVLCASRPSIRPHSAAGPSAPRRCVGRAGMSRNRRTDSKQHPRGSADIKDVKVPQPDFRTTHVQVGGNGVCDTERSTMRISTPSVHSYGDLLYPLDRRQAPSNFQAALFSAVSSLFFIGICRGSNRNPAKGRKPASERSPRLNRSMESLDEVPVIPPTWDGLPDGVKQPRSFCVSAS